MRLVCAAGAACCRRRLCGPSRVMMSKSHPNSHPKSRKRSLSKGKHGGLAAKASMEERKPAAKTVKEEKPLSHFVLELFLLLFLPLRKLGRMLFSLGPREIMKEPSLSRERPVSQLERYSWLHYYGPHLHELQWEVHYGHSLKFFFYCSRMSGLNSAFYCYISLPSLWPFRLRVSS